MPKNGRMLSTIIRSVLVVLVILIVSGAIRRGADLRLNLSAARIAGVLVIIAGAAVCVPCGQRAADQSPDSKWTIAALAGLAVAAAGAVIAIYM